uniref:WD repeat-containing protein 18 n=1 Tax=Dendroctonus ponderosae TaxID=77166 RepID=J3JUC9_DENPD|nr:unknown [Dendroctonus ponderosae]
MEKSEVLLTACQSAEQFSACLWDCKTKNVLKTYKNGGPAAPKSLSVVGDYILTAEAAKPLLHVWPLNSQEIDKNIRLVLPGAVTCLAVCPQNHYLVVGISTKLYIWQLNSGKLLSIQQRHYQPISCVEISSDSEYVIVGGDDGLLVVYFLADLVSINHSLLNQKNIGQVEPVYTKNDHSMPIRDIHSGSLGRHSRFATCSADQTVRLYTLSSGDNNLTLVFNEDVTSVLFDSPCWNLYVGTNSGIVKQCSLKNPPRSLTHHIGRKESKDFIGHKGKIIGMALNLSNSILATGADDKIVIIWDILSQQISRQLEHPAPITNLKFVPDFANFYVQNLKPQLIFKPLERNVEADSDNFVVAQVQSEDIEFSDDENILEKQLSRKSLEEQNVNLRIVNSQLYRAALEISKKYHIQRTEAPKTNGC